MADPYPKSRQLARGERRYRRKVASPKQWQAIIEAKRGPCRISGLSEPIEYHHLVPRALGGDDVADNVVPLTPAAHYQTTKRDPEALHLLAESLTDGEYAYVVSRLGEDGPRRLFGV